MFFLFLELIHFFFIIALMAYYIVVRYIILFIYEVFIVNYHCLYYRLGKITKINL